MLRFGMLSGQRSALGNSLSDEPRFRRSNMSNWFNGQADYENTLKAKTSSSCAFLVCFPEAFHVWLCWFSFYKAGNSSVLSQWAAHVQVGPLCPLRISMGFASRFQSDPVTGFRATTGDPFLCIPIVNQFLNNSFVKRIGTAALLHFTPIYLP